MKHPSFKLHEYNPSIIPEDYGALIAEAQRLQPKRVLEFGPGYSTYAWIEAGVPEIVSVEHIDDWREEKRAQFAEFPNVSVQPFWNEAPVARLGQDAGEFDLAFVDSPRGGHNKGRARLPGQQDCSRLNTLMCALKHAPIALLHDATRVDERHSLRRAELAGHKVEWFPVPSNGRTYGIARVIRDGNKETARPSVSSVAEPGGTAIRASAGV